MINQERSDEKLSSAVTFSCDPQADRESDGGDELSCYSSCGAESEFERYCSANSAMGTPSFRSSSYQDSEPGSLRNFKLGGENSNLCNSGAKKTLAGFHGGVTDFYSDEKNNELLNLNRTQRFVASAVDLMGNLDLDDNSGNEGGSKNEAVGTSGKGNRVFVEGKGFCRSVKKGGNEEENYGTEEGLSRYEHSDGDDSMFGCDTDEERKVVSYFGKNVRSCNEVSVKGENKFLVNSEVDFGSDDLDNFIQESSENNYTFMVQGERQHGNQSGIGSLSFMASNSASYPNTILADGQKEVRSIQAGGTLAQLDENDVSKNSTNLVKIDARGEDVKTGLVSSNNEVSDIDELEDYLGHNSGYDIFEMNKEITTREAPANEELKIHVAESETKHQNILLKEVDLKRAGIEGRLISSSKSSHHHHPVQLNHNEDREVNNSLPSSTASANTCDAFKKNTAFSVNKIEDHFEPVKTRNFELNDIYYEIVNDMEDVLLDSIESPGSSRTHGTRIYQSQFSRPSRDGTSSASTSAIDRPPLRIDSVEVVGSRQKEGDVSFSERLVGVRKYTVYKMRVVSGYNNWEVERRYRDFCTLYHRLKKLFDERKWTLPSPWSFVDKESRKLFGNASAEVIADRSVLIQECLQSLINQEFSFNSLNALVCFLSPSQEVPDSLPVQKRGSKMEDFSTFGKTISLFVQIRPSKSMKQILDAQHYKCAGCYKDFDDGLTRVQGFVQALGWGGPRLCEYSGQLFCSSCHNNDTAILPAKVLHNWDFTRYPVSQLAKSYLDSIRDQPMLCVSAVNPFLFSKVPTLQQVANMRSRIRTMLPYVRCPFRGSVYKGLGSRKYLLESNDFFALRDLIDLSKGVFSALPVMVETVSRKILEHITEQCLVCYDVGIPCSARQACDNTLSLIFPFQEGEVEKCKSCELVYHKNCFKKIATCPCGARIKQDDSKQTPNHGNPSALSNSNSLGGKAEPSSGLLAGLFSMVIPQKSQILRREDSRRADKDITMASLPNTTL